MNDKPKMTEGEFERSFTALLTDAMIAAQGDRHFRGMIKYLLASYLGKAVAMDSLGDAKCIDEMLTILTQLSYEEAANMQPAGKVLAAFQKAEKRDGGHDSKDGQ